MTAITCETDSLISPSPSPTMWLGKPLLFHVRLEQSEQQLTFTYSIDGKVVASFIDKDAAHIKAFNAPFYC